MATLNRPWIDGNIDDVGKNDDGQNDDIALECIFGFSIFVYFSKESGEECHRQNYQNKNIYRI